MDGGAWQAAVHRIARSRTWLHFHFSLSCMGEGNGNPLQYSCLENPRDGRARWGAIYGVTQSRTRLKRLSSSSSTLTCNQWNTYIISNKNTEFHAYKPGVIWKTENNDLLGTVGGGQFFHLDFFILGGDNRGRNIFSLFIPGSQSFFETQRRTLETWELGLSKLSVNASGSSKESRL